MCGTSGYHSGARALICMLILLFAVGFCSGVTDDCSVEPTIQYVPLGSDSKNFTCHGRDTTQRWIINGEHVQQRTSISINLKQRGFSFNWMPNISLTINATVSNNDTEIKCEVLGVERCISEVARFIVMGAPSSPELHWEAVNATWILLSWNVPFTWTNYSILQYNIIVTNTSTGEGQEVTINAMETNNKVMYYTSIEMIAKSCIELNFTVSASNALGWSGPGITTGGFPICTPGSFISSVKAEVYFQPDGTPIANITFELPYMCTYQTFKYTIVICNVTDESNIPFDVGPKEYLYSQGSSVSEVLESQLVRNAVYSIVAVTVQTAAGNSTSNDSATFNTTETLNRPTTDTTETLNQPTTDTTETLNQPTTTIHTAGSPDPTRTTDGLGTLSPVPDTTVTLNQSTTDTTVTVNQSTTVIVAAAVGSAAVVLFLVAASIAIATAVVRTRKHKQGGHTQSARVIQSAMVPNPIYEGPMYETIVPQNFDSLATNVESETPELRYLATPILPARSGETNARIGPVSNIASTAGGTEDNYTVMSPIGSHSILSLSKDTEIH